MANETKRTFTEAMTNENKRTFTEAMQERLAHLTAYERMLNDYPHDTILRLRAGYECLHTAREASEVVFRMTHGVEDVAPGLRGPVTYSKSENLLKDLLKQILSDQIILDPWDPLHRIAVALRKGADPMTIGVAATHACVALLGLHEFGGVFGAWQLAVLGFDWMTWHEHVEFNRRIHQDARRLYPEGANEAVKTYGLPGLDYLLAGSIGNIAKAGYRAVATEVDAAIRGEARDAGDTAMNEIEQKFSEDTKKLLLFPTMQAMKAACAGAMNEPAAEQRFWSTISGEEAGRILRDLERIEPSAQLVDLVKSSARRWAGRTHS